MKTQSRIRFLSLLVLLALGIFSTAAASSAAEETLVAPKVGAPWMDSAWSHRVLLTVKPTMLDGAATLNSFPMVADGSVLSTVFARARSDGADIVVTRADGTTLLPHELVEYNAATNSIELWFQADTLSTTATEFYVYYGNSAAAAVTPGAVWASDYVAVYHFAEDPGLGSLKDFTAAGNHGRADQGTSNWTAGDVGAGILGQGWLFNGTSHFINTAAIRTQDAGYTVSSWMKHATRGTDFTFQSNPGFWHVSSQASNATNNIQYQTSSVDVRWGPNPIPLNEFHQFTWVFKPTQGIIEFYYDGALQTPLSFWPPETNQTNYYVGDPLNPNGTDLVGIMGPIFFNTLDLMNGIGDEFRVSDDEKSAAWVTTGFNNQSNPVAFYTVGAEEQSTPVESSSWSGLKSRY
jgi:hypothetical protein